MDQNSIEKLDIFSQGMELADKIWHIVHKWNYFSTKTLGYQTVKAADAIAANISEGYGRFLFKETRQYCYRARGSLFETKTFVIKASNRELLSDKEFKMLLKNIEALLKKLNSYIKYIEIQIANL